MTLPTFLTPDAQPAPRLRSDTGRAMSRYEMVKRYGEAHVRRVEILSAITERMEREAASLESEADMAGQEGRS